MCLEENRNRMRTLIFLCILGLNICQAAGQDNSTQVYYFKLKADRSLQINNTIHELLTPFVSNTTFYVHNLTMTTVCENVSAGTNCTCMDGYKWSDMVCESNEGCCGNSMCTFTKGSEVPECVSENVVNITGSLTLEGQNYTDCLKPKSDEYNTCHDGLLKEMKKVYSTLEGFDSLIIQRFRLGSVITDFEMVIVSGIRAQNLIEKSTNLTRILEAKLSMETTGVVTLEMPENPVCYNSTTSLTCTSKEDLGSNPYLNLRKPTGEFSITNGSVSTITPGSLSSTIQLKGVSGLWAGQYICAYNQKKGDISIFHKATAEMDVALLPDISTFTNPSFPLCKSTTDVLQVTVNCEVVTSSENYTVTWSDSIKTQIQDTKDTRRYTNDVIIECTNSSVPPVSCTFANRRDQRRSATVKINIINAEHDKYCRAEHDWQNTKAGFTAELKCTNSAGIRRRKCTTDGVWEEEESACVNSELNSVLESALISDIGLGELDTNAADVFHRLQGVTVQTKVISSFANINASVSVLKTLSDKLKELTNVTATKNFLNSSSNLLERSLASSWTTPNPGSNSTLAETYLDSFERLLSISNVTQNTKTANVDVGLCKTPDCSNTVFNVSVNLKGASRAKTAGFLQLESYLPNNSSNETGEPNSIVVSTTADKHYDITITIDFQLLRPRRRNVEITCVSWDNTTRQWSDEGCDWAGASNEGRCICTHLSSFAILMSKEPLEVPYLTEVTIAVVSISVISLVISLIVEMIVWSDVVKTNTLYLRHTAHVNISICLLVADCCFLASVKPERISDIWCKTFVVVKHFCYLAMFFWMLCLSSTLLHQAVFLFHKVSKKNYLRFSIVLGYACPLLIVFITFLANEAGAEGSYFSKDTCWLVYAGVLSGSIYTFILPVGIIVFVNIFCMVVVIMKLLEHHNNTEKSFEKDKTAAKTVIRSVILLTPIFGVTWIFGFALMLIDLTSGVAALAVNYIFTLLNGLQGLFILLTTCVGDRMTRDALMKRFRKKAASAPTSDSTLKTNSTLKK